MKHVYNYQEIGTAIDQGREVTCTRFVTAKISVGQVPESEIVKVTVLLSQGERHIGIIETEYLSIVDVLETFAIDDLEEIWEVLA